MTQFTTSKKEHPMKTLAILAAAGLVLAGCGSPISDSEPVETSFPTSAEHVIEYRPGGSKFIGPVEASVPAPSEPVTTSQSLTDILLPPTVTQPQEPTKGSLGVFIEDYAPQPVLDTFLDAYLPEK